MRGIILFPLADESVREGEWQEALLPIFQALDRIPVGRLPALEKDRQEGDQQAEEAGGQEDPWAEGDAVVVVFQPIAHEIPGDRHRQYEGDPNVDEERAYQLRQDLLAV